MSVANSPEDASPGEARRRQRALGRRLRQMYDDVALEPVPSEFLDLLSEIDEQAPQSSKDEPRHD